MKTAHCTTSLKRRNILLVEREIREQQLAQREKAEKKKVQSVQRKQRRKQFLASPPLKLCAKVGSVFWTIFISLILTLVASYFVMNPQSFNALIRPIEQFFSINIAGAAPKSSGSLSSSSLMQSKSAELKVEKEFAPSYQGKEAELIKLLGVVRKYESEGYFGQLPLKKIEVTPVLGMRYEKLEKIIEFDQLLSNDLSQLPTEQSAVVRSDKELGAEAELQLKAAEWQWEVQGYDELGLPNEYKATVTYRGEECWLDCKLLKVTAYYAGQLNKEPEDSSNGQDANARPPQRMPTAQPAVTETAPQLPEPEDVEVLLSEPIYEEAAPSEALPTSVIEDGEPEGKKRNLLLPLIAGLSTAASAGGAAAVVFYRRRKRHNDDEQSLELEWEHDKN